MIIKNKGRLFLKLILSSFLLLLPLILFTDIPTLILHYKEIYRNGISLNDDHSLFVHTFQEQPRYSCYSNESEKAAEIIERTLLNESSNNWVFTTDLNQIVVYYPTSKKENLKKIIQLIEEKRTSYQINDRITKIVRIDSKDFDSENIIDLEQLDSSTLQAYICSVYVDLRDKFDNNAYYVSNFGKGEYLISGNHYNIQLSEQLLDNLHNPSSPKAIGDLFFQIYDLRVFEVNSFDSFDYDSIFEIIFYIPGEWDDENSNISIFYINEFSKVFIKNKRSVLEDTQIILNTLILKNSNWITLNAGLLIKKVNVNNEQEAKKIIAFCSKSNELNASEFATGHILIIIKSNELKSQIDSFLKQLENDH